MKIFFVYDHIVFREEIIIKPTIASAMKVWKTCQWSLIDAQMLVTGIWHILIYLRRVYNLMSSKEKGWHFLHLFEELERKATPTFQLFKVATADNMKGKGHTIGGLWNWKIIWRSRGKEITYGKKLSSY